jgi:mRNA-degrading endonuclease HigB of HigAB toxin-antitoxin module
MENKVTISIWEYEGFVKASEKIRVLERLLEQKDYISPDEVKAVLGIADKKKTAVAKNEVVLDA